MVYIYYLLMCLAHILASPFLLLLTYKEKYKVSVKKRFFFPNNYSSQSYDIWIHACSLGEINSVKSIVESIPKDQSVFLSAITNTGYSQANALYAHRGNITIAYLPFESALPFVAPRCKTLLVFEAELWLMLFFIAKRRGATTKLVNARISSRSSNRYARLRFFYKKLFLYVDSVFAQSLDDKDRLERLGARNVESMGNIKILNKPAVTKVYPKAKRLIILAASSHANEEEYILESFRIFRDQDYGQERVKDMDISAFIKNPSARALDKQGLASQKRIEKDSKDALLIIVPRHPERFEEAYNICQKSFPTIRFTDLNSDNLDRIRHDVLLVDAMGELINLYAISDIVVLCGAFEKIGGHNPIEPASFENALISGEHIFNQLALFALVKDYYLMDHTRLGYALRNYRDLRVSSVDSNASKDMIDRILKLS